MKELIIPTEHYDKFKFFIDLPKELKNSIYQVLSSAPIGTSPAVLIDLASNNIKKISKDRISDILSLYFNLSRAKERAEVSLDEFIDNLGDTLNSLEVEELKSSDEILADFKELLSSSRNSFITSYLLDVMTDNQKTFLEAGVNIDVRPAFDKDDNYLGSSIVYNLKVKYKEGEDYKDIFIALDGNDIDKLMITLKKSQERANKLKEQISPNSIFDIK